MSPYLLAFHQIAKCTNNRLFKIYKGCKGDFQYAWEKADEGDFMSWGIEEKIAYEIVQQRKAIYPDQIASYIEKHHIDILTWEDKEYPVLLKEIHDPPFLFYISGDKKIVSKTCLAVVGTRMISSYGKQVVEHIIPPLVSAGIVIVSGLAIGIDAYAHEITLRSQGKTIAVLGSGIDTLYPVTNKRLGEKIIEQQGAIISEFPLGMQPTNYSFPIRNRIISGLSKGVFVVEAKGKSGSLITASLALDQGRDVFTVPGNLFSLNTEGTHGLIKRGEAKSITSAQDILDEWGMQNRDEGENERDIIFDNQHQESIYLLMNKEPMMIDHIIRQSGFSSSEVNSILTILEMRGLAKNMEGMMWVRK